ncbi:hypothetical protein PR048_012950 [Dryococelus australis]|uniref:DUF4817 domain-containing protein n=1 Tax=Dryococelus australis TaxID=614101 RepID=A0ABQ9HQT1_9NEOP|nr:hypothetical protein PR048_012950 [Dryococelus australis]
MWLPCTPAQYANMHYIYCKCWGNDKAAAQHYRKKYLNEQRHPDHMLFINVHNCYMDGVIPGITDNQEHENIVCISMSKGITLTTKEYMHYFDGTTLLEYIFAKESWTDTKHIQKFLTKYYGQTNIRTHKIHNLHCWSIENHMLYGKICPNTSSVNWVAIPGILKKCLAQTIRRCPFGCTTKRVAAKRLIPVHHAQPTYVTPVNHIQELPIRIIATAAEANEERMA